MRLPTASQLGRAALCIGSCTLPTVRTTSEAAARGTEIHAFLEAANRVGRDVALAAVKDEDLHAACEALDLERLPVDPTSFAAEVTFAYDVRTGRARELGRGLNRDYSAATADEMVGTADVVGLLGDDAVIVLDWKTGHAHLPAPEDHRQLRFLALAAARAYGRDRAGVELVRLREDGTAWRERGEFDLFALAEIAEEVRGLAADVRRWAASDQRPPLTTGSHCAGCPAVSGCPAIAPMLTAIAVRPGDLEARIASELTPEHAAIAWEQVKLLEKLVDKLKGELEYYGTSHPFQLADGRMFGPHATTRDYLEGQGVWHVLSERFGAETAWKTCKLSATKKDIEALAAQIADREKRPRSHVMRELLEELRQRDALRTKHDERVAAYRVRKTKKEAQSR